MLEISKHIEIDAGHRVPGHTSKCAHPHGHRYRFTVFCQGEIVTTPGDPEEGMLTDFGFLKQLLMDRIDADLDHRFLMYRQDPLLGPARAAFGDSIIVFPYIPTAENLARWAYERLEAPIRMRSGGRIRLSAVQVDETPTSSAIYSPEGLR